MHKSRSIGLIQGDRIVMLFGPYLPLFVSSEPFPQVEVKKCFDDWHKEVDAAIDEHEKRTGVRLHG
jgi:hypothetical protein